jgi:hypothetical protein
MRAFKVNKSLIGWGNAAVHPSENRGAQKKKPKSMTWSMLAKTQKEALILLSPITPFLSL